MRRAGVCDSSWHRFRPISTPGNPRGSSKHKNSTGNIACALFESPEGFPDNFLGLARVITIKKIQDAVTQCYIADIPPGTYAIAVVHDENMNGELDTNWLGVPKEGYGFSNTTIDEFGAPAFSAASFQYDGKNIDLTIGLNY